MSTEDPLQAVRTALAAYRTDEATERVARWRRDPAASTIAEVVARHRWLGGRGARDAVAEAAERGLFETGEHGAMIAHQAQIQAEGACAELRQGLEALGEGPADGRGGQARVWDVLGALWEPGGPPHEAADRLVDLAARVVARAREAREHAEEVAAATGWGAPGHPDDGVTCEGGRVSAEAFLQATRDAGEEATRHLLGLAGEPATWLGLVRAARARALDPLFPPAGRFRRVSAVLLPRRFERDVRARLHVERPHAGASPRVRIAARAIPGDVRIAPGRLELGALSELAAAEGVGRGLALTLVSPGVPPAFRWPLVGSVPRALGGLLVQIVIEPRTLAQDDRLAPVHRERVGRTLGAIALLHHRLVAASVVAGAAADADDASVAFADALGIEVPRAVGALAGLAVAGNRDRLRGSLGALSAWAALREVYDEDWYRNPRAEEALRAGCARGGALSIEAFVRELGGDGAAAIPRALELFPT